MVRTWIVLLAATVTFGHFAAAQSPAEDLLRKQQNWEIRCMPKGCIGSVDILRGESGDPPNPNDVNQYVSVAVGVDRKDRRATMINFEVDPNADKSIGVLLLFARTVPDGKSWKVVLDEAGPVHLQFTRCDQTECIASIGGGNPDQESMSRCSDLIQRMQAEDHLFVTYVRGRHTYRTAVSLKLFKEAYQELLAKLSTPSTANP